VTRLAAALLLLAAASAFAQPAPGTDAVYHGLLGVRSAAGRFDPLTGNGTLSFPRWRILPTPSSNGVFPAEEPLLIQLGDFNQYTLPAGSLTAAKNGSRFSYRAPKGAGERVIKRMVLKRRADGSWAVRFVMTGLELSRLVIEDPVCLGMAFIIGDDDFFSGVNLTRKSFTARRVKVDGECEAGEWPWL
jgi:hypothetical protein